MAQVSYVMKTKLNMWCSN